MINNPHIGSSLDEFLENDNKLSEAEAIALRTCFSLANFTSDGGKRIDKNRDG